MGNSATPSAATPMILVTGSLVIQWLPGVLCPRNAIRKIPIVKSVPTKMSRIEVWKLSLIEACIWPSLRKPPTTRTTGRPIARTPSAVRTP